MPCDFDVTIEALALNKRKRPMFRLSVVSHEPPGHTPPAFLFLSSTMSKSGEDFHPPNHTEQTRSFSWPPFWAVPASFASCIRMRQGAFALSSSARPFSDGGYMSGQ